MTRPKLLDLFCCQGGAAMGYHLAGFDVVGVDITPQPRFPFEFVQADAFAYLQKNWRDFDAVHASPPCQAYTLAQRIQRNEHPDLISSLRDALAPMGVMWVIENVVGSPLEEPIELCGAMFGFGTYRHRWFESNVRVTQPPHPEHTVRTTKMGRVVGHFAGVAQARQAMGIDWMTRDGLREAIPPAYTQHIGAQLLAYLQTEELAA